MKHSKYVELVERVFFRLDFGLWNVKSIAKELKTSQKMVNRIIKEEYFGIGVTTEFERKTWR